jgi:hypothetical protein
MELEQRVGTAAIPDVWADSQPTTHVVMEMAQSKMAQARLLAGPRDSIALHDERQVIDSFTGRPRLSVYTPVNTREPGFRVDVDSKVDLKEMHEVGFKTNLSGWREPREPEDDFFVPLNSSADAQDLVNRKGFDYLMTF